MLIQKEENQNKVRKMIRKERAGLPKRVKRWRTDNTSVVDWVRRRSGVRLIYPGGENNGRLDCSCHPFALGHLATRIQGEEAWAVVNLPGCIKDVTFETRQNLCKSGF